MNVSEAGMKQTTSVKVANLINFLVSLPVYYSLFAYFCLHYKCRLMYER